MSIDALLQRHRHAHDLWAATKVNASRRVLSWNAWIGAPEDTDPSIRPPEAAFAAALRGHFFTLVYYLAVLWIAILAVAWFRGPWLARRLRSRAHLRLHKAELNEALQHTLPDDGPQRRRQQLAVAVFGVFFLLGPTVAAAAFALPALWSIMDHHKVLIAEAVQGERHAASLRWIKAFASDYVGASLGHMVALCGSAYHQGVGAVIREVGNLWFLLRTLASGALLCYVVYWVCRRGADVLHQLQFAQRDLVNDARHRVVRLLVASHSLLRGETPAETARAVMALHGGDGLAMATVAATLAVGAPIPTASLISDLRGGQTAATTPAAVLPTSIQ